MNTALFERLQQVDTPTVCNAIEVAQGTRGFNQFTKQTMLSSAPKAAAVVGYARTAQISAVNPPTEAPDIIKQRRMDYYRHMAQGSSQSKSTPYPGVAVIEDMDYPHAIGAFWGEINTNVHKGLGLVGALTNGVMRDLGDLPKGFPVIAGSIGPSHGFVHINTIAQPVTIMGMLVTDGDLIHADRHGAVVIPPQVIPDLLVAIDKLLASEQLVLHPARQADFDFDKFVQAWTAFEQSRT